MALNVAVSYTAQNTQLDAIYTAPTNSSFSVLPHINVMGTKEYTGKSIVRVPAGLFETYVRIDTTKIENEDGQFLLGEHESFLTNHIFTTTKN